MKNDKSKNIIIGLLVVIIIILGTLVVLFATDKITFNSNNVDKNNIEENNPEYETQDNNIEKEPKKKYDNFIGTWENKETLNNISIKKITDNEITFTWFLYRLTGIDEDTTISFENGRGIFYFEGYEDKNFDSKQTEDEKYIRKAIIHLTDNGVDVIVEDVSSIDNNYKIVDNFDSVWVKSGTYSHPTKLNQ